MNAVIRKVAVVLACTQACALAASGSQKDAASTAAPNFICGGVGEADQQAMKAQAAQHDLMLTFAESTGAYLSDVAVQIRDLRGGVVLDTICHGPIMLVDLPRAGRWRVTAQVNGASREKTVATTAGHTTRVSLTWPAGTS